MADPQYFNLGDVVRLKTGPKMTVVGWGPDESTGEYHVWVTWLDEKGQTQNGYYPVTEVALS